jgi:stage II sporulation protein P
MATHKKAAQFNRRMLALAAATVTLWTVIITAGSKTLSAAAASILEQFTSPMALLRWELADLWPDDGLSVATAMALGESPLLLSARSQITALWSREQGEDLPAADLPTEPTIELPEITEPVQETPVVSPPTPELPPESDLDFTDNGIPARTLVPTDPAGYTVCGRVYISNTTKLPLDSGKLTEPFDAQLTDEAPQILIVHTHGSEAYTPVDDSDVIWSGEHRTTDSRYNVVGIGDEIARVLAKNGLSVIHDRNMYDYPQYSGAYDRSLASIEQYLRDYPSIRFVLDVHRDAIEDASGQDYKVVSVIEEQGTAAQLSLVMGSSAGGLAHPHWLENVKLATALQENLLAKYPTLMRPMLLRSSRYNQHTTTGSLLVEVGAAGNSPDEAMLAARLFAQNMADVLLNLP